MVKSKVVRILKTLSKAELQQFDKFIISPVYNSAGIYVVRFYSEIKNFYPDFESEKFTGEHVFKKLYPGRKYNDSTIRKLISELMKLLEEFLIFTNLERDSHRKDRLLLDELSLRRIDNLFEIKSKQSNKLVEKDRLKDTQYYYNKFRLASLSKTFYFNRDREKSLMYFNKEAENFISYFSLMMIHMYVERLKEKRNFTDADFDLNLFEEISGYIEKNIPERSNAYKIFSSELMLYKENDDSAYFRLKELKEKFYKIIPAEELNSIYTTLVNFAAEKYEKGNDLFLKEIFGLNKESLERNVMGRYLSEFQFINIVTVSISLNELKFAESFIKKYPGSLNPDIRDSILNYCNANLSFAKKNYRESLDYLLKINFKLNQQKFLVKNLTIKNYYELGQFEPIYSLMDSYKHILKREKLVPKAIKDLMHNFLKFTKELCELQEGKGEKGEIMSRVKKTATAQKKWLSEKLK
ncbi:MAG: hypothetical protein SGI89_15450 [bacterium]|nr:hypothetical protein [bacterium]